jgi:hypothetical protein
MKKKRTIMRAFKLNEISGVDNPAQAHARVAIIKRHDGDNTEEGNTTLEQNDFFKALAFVLKHFHQARCACGKKSAESVVAGVCQRRSI